MYSNSKIEQQLRTLNTYIYSNFKPISTLEIWHDTRSDHKPLPTNEPFEPITLGSTWEGRDQYYWLRFNVNVPVVKEGEHYVIHLDLGRTGGGGNSGFEGLVHLNGHPRQAVDANHKDIYLESTWSSQTIQVAILMWTGLEGGGPKKIQHYVLQDVSAGLLNTPIRDCYRWLEVLYETTVELDDDEPLPYEYRKLVDSIIKRFVWGAMSLADIIDAAKLGLKDIEKFIETHKNQKKQFRISAIGHTHIDVAWLWRLRHTREKTARSFSTVLELMREYPEYVFMHSTPQVWQFIKEDYPELYEQIKERVREGRFEPEGATWLEPDANIPSGEALTRQFLYGTRFFQKEFNAKQNVLWLPDVFGYSWALPQIMKGFGINNFMTTKISWNDTNRMPHDTFIWKGIDGSEVLTHFITTVDPGVPYKNTNNFEYTYNGKITPHTVLGSYSVYADKMLNNDLLLSYGWGDGGGGPQREMIENMKMIDQLPALPTVKPTRVDDYFRQLQRTIKESSQKPAEWNGELYLEFHRGTYTSQARVKKENRQLEFAMRDLEARYVKAGMAYGAAYPTGKIQKLWERILCNQFHDILPGSSIHEVYEDNKVEYEACFSEITKLNKALDDAHYIRTPDLYTIRNLNAWTLTDLVTVSEARTGYFTDNEGRILKSEKHGEQYLVAVSVPGLSETVIRFTADDIMVSSGKADQNMVANAHYQVKWDDNGQLTSIYDRDNAREVLAIGNRSNVLTVYEDRPTSFDNWNIDADYPEKAIILHANQVVVHAPGPLTQRVDFHYTFQNSTVVQTMTLYTNSRRIDFKTHIDWHEHQFLLRTAFNTAILSNYATFDIQYGNVARPTTSNTSWEIAKFETVSHKWADLSQHDYGVSLLNDSKYGYSVKKGQLSLSLLKSGIDPDTEADQGEHDFTYSLLPHAGDFVTGRVEEIAMALNHGLTVIEGEPKKISKPLFTFETEQPVMVDAIKHSEEGNQAILRFHEYAGQNAVVKVVPQFDFEQVSRVRLDETHPEVLNNQDGILVSLKPYEVVTLAFER